MAMHYGDLQRTAKDVFLALVLPSFSRMHYMFLLLCVRLFSYVARKKNYMRNSFGLRYYNTILLPGGSSDTGGYFKALTVPHC